MSESEKQVEPIIVKNVEQGSKLLTDAHGAYKTVAGRNPYEHESVEHMAKEYVRGEASTNTVEGYFSLLKRGLTGTYHHVSPHHLHRYLDEFNFRYNARSANDAVRNLSALKATEGKRLQYK